jgi:membrane-bound lytic murein transglycosylase D
MIFMRYIVAFFTFFSVTLNASLNDALIDQSHHISVLTQLDIENSYATDEHLRGILDNYKLYKRTIMLQVLSDAYIYFPMIKQMLGESGLPDSLVYMAMAESNFNNSAYSKAKAVGMWQFMPKTAAIFDLKINRYVDERRDPIKATKAAIKYLTSLHKRFGKWYLAMMAYNCGGGRLSWAIKKARSDDLSVLLQVKKGRKRQYLPGETRNYIRKIIALSTLSESESMLLSSNNMHLLNRGISYPIATVNVSAGTPLSEIATTIGTSLKSLKKLNPALKHNFAPPYAKKYDITIPYEKLAIFKANFKRKNPKEMYIMYTVKSGDNLSSIGKSFGVGYQMIRDFNHLRKKSYLKIGQELIIPTEKGNRFVYKIRRGDTLISISKKFGLTRKRIKEINNNPFKVIYAGQKIIIQR